MNKEKLIENYQDSLLAKRIDATEIFAINHGFPEWKGETVQDLISQSYQQGRMEALEEVERELTTPIKMLDTGEETNKITYDCIKHRINNLKLN